MKCLNCGKEGSHFVSPSLGEPGFYICEELPNLEEEADVKNFGIGYVLICPCDGVMMQYRNEYNTPHYKCPICKRIVFIKKLEED